MVVISSSLRKFLGVMVIIAIIAVARFLKHVWRDVERIIVRIVRNLVRGI